MNLHNIFYLCIFFSISLFSADNHGPVLTDSYMESLDPMAPLFDSREFGRAKPSHEQQNQKPAAPNVPKQPLEDEEFVNIARDSFKTSLSRSGMLEQINLQQSDDKKLEEIKAFLIAFLEEFKRKHSFRDHALNDILALQDTTKKAKPMQSIDLAIDDTLQALKKRYSNPAGLKELLQQCSSTDSKQFVDSLDDETLLALAQEKEKKPKQHGCSLS